MPHYSDFLFSRLKVIVPWRITRWTTLEKSIIFILPGVTVDIEPSFTVGYYLNLGENKDRIRYGKSKVEQLIGSVQHIVQGELDRIKSCPIKPSQIIKISDTLERMEKKMDELIKENKRLERKVKRSGKKLKEALAFHPLSQEAQTAKQDFEGLINQQT